ncbi:MAG: PIG-L family deacetylase, partial [Acidimicrobiales bacterium]|nr:PIG-L family deacetylase [Acidimicrobiales bacterium]
RDPHFFRDVGLEHHRPSALLLFEADEPDHAEPVTEAGLVAKLAALESHTSQFESTMFISSDDPAAGAAERARFRAEVRSGVEEAGEWADVVLAERFRFMPTDR